jgi:hypothetical protein
LKRNKFPSLANGAFPETLSSARMNRILQIFGADANYLEIGIENANTFANVIAAKKVGVDPYPLVNVVNMEPNVCILPTTSNAFFRGNREVFDVCFIDGLHFWEQTYLDIINFFAHSPSKSVAIVDDIVPLDKYSAMRSQTLCNFFKHIHGLENKWMGDVFKVIFVLEKYHESNIRFATINDPNSHHQLVIWKTSNVANPVNKRIRKKIARTFPYVKVFSEGIPENFRLASFREIELTIKEYLNAK